MKKVIFLLFLAYFTAGQKNETIDDLVDSIFGEVSSNTTKHQLTTITSKSQDCECVPYYLCTPSQTGTGVIDISEATQCASYLEVCCKIRDRQNETYIPPPQAKACGYRNVDGLGFRIKGAIHNESEYGEFPWMVAVLREMYLNKTDETVNVYKCGGALIHPQVVLTAAHCVASLEKYKIRAGEWDSQTKNELFPHQDRYARNIAIHHDYSSTTLMNDIAIIFLESPVELEENVNILCLPEQNMIIPSGTKCFTTGWGKNVRGKMGQYQTILKKIEVPMVDHNTCQEKFRNSRLGARFHLHKSFVCAGGEKGKDTCDGDGGSPLACPLPGKENIYQHIGMVAWGAGCGEYETPGVYVNVGLYRDWIEKYLSIYHITLS